MAYDILDFGSHLRSRELNDRRQEGIKGLIEEIKERDPSIDLTIDMKCYAAIECGRIVQNLREEARLTQKQLADCLGVTQQFVSKIETGRAKTGVNVYILYKVANVCNSELIITWSPKKTKRDGKVVDLPGKNVTSKTSDSRQRKSNKAK